MPKKRQFGRPLPDSRAHALNSKPVRLQPGTTNAGVEHRRLGGLAGDEVVIERVVAVLDDDALVDGGRHRRAVVQRRGVVAAAGDARHPGETRQRRRVTPHATVEEGERPGEDVGDVARVEPVLDAAQRDELPGRAEPDHAVLDLRQRGGGVGGPGDCEVGQAHTVDAVLVATERGQDRLAEIRNVADRRFQARLDEHALPSLTDRRREAGAAQQQHRLAAQARPEAADPVGIDDVAPLRMGEQPVERGDQAGRPQCLHRDKAVEAQDRRENLADVVEAHLGEPPVAVERRRDDVAVTREQRHEVEVAAPQRTAPETVREQQHRPAPAAIGEDRGLAAALHPRHPAAVWQREVGARIGGRRRIADECRRSEAAAPVPAEELAIVGNGERLYLSRPRLNEEVGHVARTAVATRLAVPVARGVLAGSKPGEVLVDVVAGHRVGAGGRCRRHDRVVDWLGGRRPGRAAPPGQRHQRLPSHGRDCARRARWPPSQSPGGRTPGCRHRFSPFASMPGRPPRGTRGDRWRVPSRSYQTDGDRRRFPHGPATPPGATRAGDGVRNPLAGRPLRLPPLPAGPAGTLAAPFCCHEPQARPHAAAIRGVTGEFAALGAASPTEGRWTRGGRHWC